MPNFAPLIQSIYTQIHQFKRWLYGVYTMRWIQWFMRFGHGAKGMLYGLIGLFVVNDLLHNAPPVAGSQGVLVSLGRRPMGSIMLSLLAIGLLGYVLWRFLQASLDPAHAGDISFQRVVQRCGYVVSGLTYLGIAQSAGRLAVHLTIDFDDTIEDLASVLFERTIGPWMLLAIGLGVVGIGLTYIYGAATGSYINQFRDELYSMMWQWAVWVGKIGITARGVGFVLIGLYLMVSAYRVDAESAGGLGNVFDQLDDHLFGEVWLGAIAFGFIAYATYMIISALYRRFPTLDPKEL